MFKLLPKIISILLGIAFLVGVASTASAAPASTDKKEWAFEYKLTQSYLVKMGAWFSGGGSAPEITGQIQSYTSQASCAAGEASWASDSDYTITRSCYETTPAALAVARGVALANIQSADFTGDPLLKNLNCSITNGAFGIKGTLVECVPVLTYYVIYKPASWFLVGSGYIFDAMLTLSIDRSFIDQKFVESTWLIVRDFSNMLFIFILIFAGVQTILNMGNWKNTIKLVIVMALLINFSLFFTKVVIDAGNILAVGIYSSMGTEKSAVDQSFQVVGNVPERDISGRLAAAFQPQQFLDSAGKVEALDATIVFLVATVVSGYAGYVFFKVALLFIGRLIAFWFLMIVSPFAFISIALPAKANKFQGWLDELINQAFVAPVFLFFIYIIMQVLYAGDGLLIGIIKESPTVGPFTFDKVLGPVIVATLLVLALQKALEFAKDLSGKFGELGAGIGGAALGIATTGTAMVGRKFLGGAGALALRSGLVSSESKVGGYAKSLTQASFDVRNLGGKDSMFGKTIGGGIAKGVGSLGLGKGGGVGGVEKAEKDRIEKTLEKAKGKEMSLFEEERVRARAEKESKKQQVSDSMATSKAAFSAKLKKDRSSQLKEEVESAQKAHDESETAKEVEKTKAAYEESVRDRMRGGSSTAVDAAKAEFDTATAAHASSGTSVALQAKLDELRKAEQEAASTAESEAPTTAEGPTEKPKSAKERADADIKKENERRRNAYADKVEKGGWFGLGSNRAAAAKIRKGDESGKSKNLKALAKKKKDAEEAGKNEDVIKYIDEEIEKEKEK